MSADVNPEEVLAQVVGTFLPAAPKRKRRPPNRCLRCRRVTRHIFCQACHEHRRREGAS